MKLSIVAVAAICLSAMCRPVFAQVAESLKAIGMENIRCTESTGKTIVCFEDNVYRSAYEGVGKAIEACLNAAAEGDLQMVVLDNRVPRLSIELPASLVAAYRKGEASLTDVYRQMDITTDTDGAMTALNNLPKAERKTQASSAWKPDIVVYPHVFLENNTLDELYTYAVSLCPALEMDLWKGGQLTAQVIFPVSTNLDSERSRIRPGIVALKQGFRLRHNWFGTIAAGNFTDNRYGIRGELKYRSRDGRIELGGRVGSTGYSGMLRKNGGTEWYMGRKQRVDATLMASYYEPHANLQMDLQASRYIFGDFGVRGDCTRHFGEYAVGVYAVYTDGKVNGGFHFAIPLPGKKWKRQGGFFRLKPADYFSWSYGMVADGEYIEKKLERSYNTVPNYNRSTAYYQPDYIRYFLIKNRELKQNKIN